MSDFPYPINDGTTHFEGCWKTRGHHNCAVAKVIELSDQIISLPVQLDHISNNLCNEGLWSLANELNDIIANMVARVK